MEALTITAMAPPTRYRLLFEWARYEEALRAAAAQRGWTADQIAAALERDRLCTIEVRDLEPHLDWHERLGFAPPKSGLAEG
jgi:hypothetical protein